MLRGLAWAARRLACHAGGGGWVGRRVGEASWCYAYGIVCFHLQRRPMVFSAGGNTQSQLGLRGVGARFSMAVTVHPFFSLFYGGTGGHGPSIPLSYHIIS